MRKRNAIIGVIATLAMFAAPTTAAFAADTTAAATDVPITISTFPDPVFLAYVKANFDKNGDGSLSASEIANATSISMRRKVSDSDYLKVHSMQGIQYLTNLQSLDLFSNALTSLDLTHNTKLTMVVLCNNKFTSAVDFSKNTALTVLMANYANLPSIDVSHNTKLTNLQLDGNQFAALDLTKNTRLTKVYANWNPLVALRTASGQKVDFLGDSGKAVTSIDGHDHYDRGHQANNLVGGSYDLKKAVPWIDASKISNVKGAKLSGTTLTNVTATDVTYQYAIGNASGAKLTAHIQFVSVPDISVAVPNSVDNISLTTTAGRKPALPSTVTVHYSDGTTQQRSVKWNDSTDWTTRKLLPQPVIISGDVDGVTVLKAHANITIQSPFTDVNDLTPHATDIYWLSGQNITQGFKDGSFGGMRTVVRQDMAAFLYRLAGSPKYTPSAADKRRFKDVTDKTPHHNEIWWLAHTGIAQGYKDGTFGGMRTVVRQDMAAFLRRFAAMEGVASAKNFSGPSADLRARYVDVSGSPHEQDVWWLLSTGVAQGYPDHTYGGMRNVVRQDMAAFLHRMKTNVLKK